MEMSFRAIVFVSLSCLSCIVNCQVVNITVTPSDATLLVGQNVTIHCATSLPAEITVQINGEYAATYPRVVDTDPGSVPNDRTFLFTSVTQEDNGLVFTCFVSGISSDEVILNVQSVTSTITSTVSITSTISSSPTSSFEFVEFESSSLLSFIEFESSIISLQSPVFPTEMASSISIYSSKKITHEMVSITPTASSSISTLYPTDIVSTSISTTSRATSSTNSSTSSTNSSTSSTNSSTSSISSSISSTSSSTSQGTPYPTETVDPNDQQSSCTDECNPQFDGVQYSVCCDTDNISTFIAVKSSDSSSAAKRYIACPDYIPDWCE